MITRRNFSAAIIAASTLPASSIAGSRGRGFGPLQADPAKLLDLPAGFSYSIVARAGEMMNDGLLVPGYADGMAAFRGASGSVVLVCNHEIEPWETHLSAFRADLSLYDRCDPDLIYDRGSDKTPLGGGTTTLVYDTQQQKTIRKHLSLAGTELNCAGGTTPWGSWLSCEEAFRDPGTSTNKRGTVTRDQRHGYVFEVPSATRGMVKPEPLRDMGRFEHEAAAVDPRSGFIYQTEDRHSSLFYRFLPREPGNLTAGGTLQALTVREKPQLDTRNWGDSETVEVNTWMPVEWITLDNVDSAEDDLRLRGHQAGASRFARGEGLCYANGSLFFTCTIGGPDRLGQIFEYRPDPNGRESGGHLRLLAQSGADSILHHADNITMSPWGDLVVCEDTSGPCGLVGLSTDGKLYPLAYGAYSSSELAGVCFAPDGKTLFVNIQEPGMTLAIQGPW